jgi:uncharacterized membrane protein
MENKHNLNYFKKSGWQKPVGLALLIIGILFLFFGWSYLSYILMVIFIPAGVALFLIGASVRSSDEDIDEYIQKQLADFNVNLEEDRNYARRILKHMPPENVGTYRFEDGLMLTKTKTGTPRSSEYVSSKIYVLSDGLYVATRKISIVEDSVENKTYEISYDIMNKVEITREQKRLVYANRTFFLTSTYLHVEYGSGFLLDLPVPDNVGSDQIAEKIIKAKGNYLSDKEKK